MFLILYFRKDLEYRFMLNWIEVWSLGFYKFLGVLEMGRGWVVLVWKGKVLSSSQRLSKQLEISSSFKIQS
eukprot:snap_masked-scaffold_7-processed-gene-4.17-mRNA-1 protein AED:1.00 eAED:1.00 QI:0/0/0/0/1/1/2/0/70